MVFMFERKIIKNGWFIQVKIKIKMKSFQIFRFFSDAYHLWLKKEYLALLLLTFSNIFLGTFEQNNAGLVRSQRMEEKVLPGKMSRAGDKEILSNDDSGGRFLRN